MVSISSNRWFFPGSPENLCQYFSSWIDWIGLKFDGLVRLYVSLFFIQFLIPRWSTMAGNPTPECPGGLVRWRFPKHFASSSLWARRSMVAARWVCRQMVAVSWMQWSMWLDLQIFKTYIYFISHIVNWIFMDDHFIPHGISGRTGDTLKRIRVEKLQESGFDHPTDDMGYPLPYVEQTAPLAPSCCLASMIWYRFQDHFIPWIDLKVAVSFESFATLRRLGTSDNHGWRGETAGRAQCLV